MDVFSFDKQLVVGDRGEELFLERYPTKITIYTGREYDFTCSATGKKIELKTDTYNMTKTPNFFMERYSDVNRKTVGGPWRAVRDNVDIFCYYFVRHNCWFQFNNLPALTERLDELTAKQGLIYIKNKGWVTGGYTVKRDALEDLYDIYEWKD